MNLDRIRKWIDKYLLLVLIPALAAFFYIYNPAESIYQHLFLKCFFHRATGLYCPGCSGQRPVHQLLHGHIVQAADYNLLLVAALPFLLWNAGLYIRNRFSAHRHSFTYLYHPLTTRVLLITLLLFWVLRNVPFYPFSWLAP